MRYSLSGIGVCACLAHAACAGVVFVQPVNNPYQGFTNASGVVRNTDPPRALTPQGNVQPMFVVSSATSGVGGTSGGLDDPSPPAGQSAVVARLNVSLDAVILGSQAIRISVSGSATFNNPSLYDAAINSSASLSGIRFHVDQPSPFVIARSGVFATSAVRLIDSSFNPVPDGSVLAIGDYELSSVPINYSVSDENTLPTAPSGVLLVTIPSPPTALLLALALGRWPRSRRGLSDSAPPRRVITSTRQLFSPNS